MSNNDNKKYKRKYEKYKNKYLDLKKKFKQKKYDYFINNKYSDLFYDLLQTNEDILKISGKDDFFILVGESPSYLKPFLEDAGHKIFDLPFSNKPYACLFGLYGLPYSNEEFINRSLMPKPDYEEYYFNYLNKETILTRDFLKENWFKIVLIDVSSGPSITGVSIFLNRYVGNIKKEQKCLDFEGAVPLRFLHITNNMITPNLNTDPYYSMKVAEEAKVFNFNYHPFLIILMGKVYFESAKKFLMSKYPRYVPSHIIHLWNKPPYREDYEEMYKEGLELLKLITNMLKEYRLHHMY